MITLHRIDKDDLRLVDLVEHLLNEMVQRYKPNEIYSLLIDNWFDYKWLNFSGTVMDEIAVWKSNL